MANYYLNDDGSMSKENKKKKKGTDYKLNDNGSISPIKTTSSTKTQVSPVAQNFKDFQYKKLDTQQLLTNSNRIPLKNTEIKSPMLDNYKKEKDEKRKNVVEKIVQKPKAFNDGYNFGDVTKTVAGTTADIGLGIVKGVATTGEGVGKLLAGGVAQVADWVGKDEYANKVRNNIATKEAPVSGTINKWQKGINDYSAAGETTDKVSEALGYIGSIAVGGAAGGAAKGASIASKGLSAADKAAKVAKATNAVQTGLMFSSATGNALGEAYSKEGVTNEQAWAKAIGTGAIETTTEKLFGLFGTSGLDTGIANAISKKISSGAGKMLARTGVQASGEAVEEFLSYAGGQGLDLAIDAVSKGKGAQFKEDWNWEEVGEQMAIAAMASGVLGGGVNVAEINRLKAEEGLTTQQAIDEIGKRQDAQAELEKQQANQQENQQTNQQEAVVQQQEQKTQQEIEQPKVQQEQEIQQQEQVDPIQQAKEEAQVLLEEVQKKQAEQKATQDARESEIIQQQINELEAQRAPLLQQIEESNSKQYADKITKLEETKAAYKDNPVIVEAINNQIKKVKQDAKTEENEYIAPISSKEVAEQTHAQNMESLQEVEETDIPQTQEQNTDVAIDENTTDISKRLSDTFGLDNKQTKELYNKAAKAESVEQTRKILEDYKDINETVNDDRVKAIRKQIWGTKLNVSNIKSSITDFREWRKKNFGKLRLGNDGMNVDSFYQELSSQYPDFFDSNISNELDQLEAISDFMENNKTSYTQKIGEISNKDLDNLAEKVYAEVHANEFNNDKEYQNSLKDLDKVIDNAEIQAKSIEEVKNTVTDLNTQIGELKSMLEEMKTFNKFENQIMQIKEPTKITEQVTEQVNEQVNEQVKTVMEETKEDLINAFREETAKLSQENTAKIVKPSKTNKKAPISRSTTQMNNDTTNTIKTPQNANTEVENQDTKQRKWIGTSTESEVVNRQILPDDLDQQAINYEPITNKDTLNKANAKLNSLGDYDRAVEYFNTKLLDKKTSVEDIVLGERLIQEALKKGDTKTAGDLIQNVAILGTELGQKVQALSIIQRMTPEGQLKMLDKTINRAKMKGDKSFNDVEITQEIKDKILNTYNKDGSYNQEELNKAVEEAKQEIANQMIVTKAEKINAWRYLAMLGNPKTHIRNLVSNVAMKGTLKAKNAVARTIETVAPIENRTRTWKPASKEIKNFAKESSAEMKETILSHGGYNEDTSIKMMRDTFKNKILNSAYNFNNDMLEKEDWWFSKGAYESSLAEYLTANGIRTQEDLVNNSKLVGQAKMYAVEQAQIATFRQYSYLAEKIREVENKNAFAQAAIGSILPFKKTPINIAKAGLSYSPLGFTKTLTYDIAQVKKGNMEASTLVDHLAQNITGTGLVLVGYMLAKAGLINGAGDDDKEGKYDTQLGKQAYSLNIGGSTYSLSWLSPVAMPLFVGTNAYEQLEEGKEWNGDVVVETLSKTLDPLNEMSFLSGLSDTLSSYETGTQKFAGIFETMAQNYATQFVPTLSSQVANATDDLKRSTKVGADTNFKFLDETVNKLKYKIPGLRQTLQPSTDIWGNEVKQTENKLVRTYESFIAPYAKKESIATDIDNNIRDVYSSVGDDKVLPTTPKNKLKFGDEEYKMSEEEYTNFKKTYGQTANKTLEDLFNTTTYKEAGDDEKADMINDVYTYSNDIAKKEYLDSKGVEYTNSTEDNEKVYKENAIKGAIEMDMSVDDYRQYKKVETELQAINLNNEQIKTYVKTANTLNDIAEKYSDVKDDIVYEKKSDEYKQETSELSLKKKREIVDSIKSSGLTDEAKALLYKSKYSSDTIDSIVDAHISVDDYMEYETQVFEADHYANGKTISNSRKNKVINYVNNLSMTVPQKAMLIKYTNSFKFNDYNNDIVQYVSNLDMTYERKKSLLKELDMNVYDDGTVTWK